MSAAGITLGGFASQPVLLFGGEQAGGKLTNQIVVVNLDTGVALTSAETLPQAMKWTAAAFNSPGKAAYVSGGYPEPVSNTKYKPLPTSAQDVQLLLAGSVITVAWTPPSQTGGIPVQYQVQIIGTGPGATNSLLIETASQLSYAQSVYCAPPGSPQDTYTATVTALNAAGYGPAASPSNVKSVSC
jgi:hypothetical protein